MKPDPRAECKPKRYAVCRKGYKMKADSLEWLTQYNGGKEDDIIASLMNYGVTKKEDAGGVTTKG